MKWLLEAADKIKLRTFVAIYESDALRTIIEANLPRGQWSLVSKLKLGVLLLALEVGRWKDTPLEKRLCVACDAGLLENEYHFLLFCECYKDTRTEWFHELEEVDGLVVGGSQEQIV